MSKTVLLTGAAGFIGHHLLDQILTETDWQVVVLDRLDHAGNLNRLVQLDSFQRERRRVKVVFHDLRAAINPGVAREIGGTSFNYCLHLAAGSHVDRSITDPCGFILDNVVGTANLLNYCRTAVQRTLIFSTDEVFGPAEQGQCFAEDARLNPNNPYAATKAGAELLAPAYANSYGMELQVTRCANVFGERQDPEKFIPLCIRRILTGETVQIHARRVGEKMISSSRLYTYHRNVTSAVLKILESGDTIRGEDARTGRYNIEGGEEVSNVEVAMEIARQIQKDLNYEYVTDPPGRPRPDMRYSLDSSRLRSLGWSPDVSFPDGLARTIEAELLALGA